MHGFNSRNLSIRVPTREITPPLMLSEEKDEFGVKMYTTIGKLNACI